MDKVEGLRIIGRAPEKAAVVSFLVEGARARDLAHPCSTWRRGVRSASTAHPLLQFYVATCASLPSTIPDAIDAFMYAQD